MTTHQLDSRSGTGVAGALAGVRNEVRGLGTTLWAARPRAELMEAVAEVEALKSSLDALELAMVRELDATGAVKGAGWASTQDYVTSVAGGHKGTGPATVRLAKAVEGTVLAPVGEALAEGWLSTAKALVIERAVDALPGDLGLRSRGVQVLLGEAEGLDASELRKVARRLLSLVDPEGEDRRAEADLDRLERAAHLGRALTITDDQCGGAWIKGRCATEDAALIKATLFPLAAPQPNSGPICESATCDVPGCSHTGRDPRDRGSRMLDALVESCRLLQTADLLPTSHGGVPRLTLTMSLTELRTLSGFATTETGEQLSPSAIRRLCCDAEVIPVVLGAKSEVLDVGRLQRLVTAAIWRALVARDQHCRFPSCTRPPLMCHAHHVEHWADGGSTSLPNMVLLCGHHHRLIHRAPWTIRHDGAAGFTFAPPPSSRNQGSAPPRPPPQK